MTLGLDWTQPGTSHLGLTWGLQCDDGSWARVIPKSDPMSGHQLESQLELSGRAPTCGLRVRPGLAPIMASGLGQGAYQPGGSWVTLHGPALRATLG